MCYSPFLNSVCETEFKPFVNVVLGVVTLGHNCLRFFFSSPCKLPFILLCTVCWFSQSPDSTAVIYEQLTVYVLISFIFTPALELPHGQTRNKSVELKFYKKKKKYNGWSLTCLGCHMMMVNPYAVLVTFIPGLFVNPVKPDRQGWFLT